MGAHTVSAKESHAPNSLSQQDEFERNLVPGRRILLNLCCPDKRTAIVSCPEIFASRSFGVNMMNGLCWLVLLLLNLLVLCSGRQLRQAIPGNSLPTPAEDCVDDCFQINGLWACEVRK